LSAAAALARAEAAGVQLALDAGGAVQMRATAPPPAAVVADLRQHREAVAALLLERQRAAGNNGEQRQRAAFYLRAMAEAAEAMAAPDPDLAAERVEAAAAQAAEARGDHGATLPAEDHQRHLAALLDTSRQRPAAWPDQTRRPRLGDYHTACRGRRWWAPQRPSADCTGVGAGWACGFCHPAPPGAAIEEVQT
jgi:hypothetical protein